ncbi:MAG TPA: CpaF family protein [Chloroflexota bacterium]|nr:CpaF family protein [Chloroflexota bacterium]
MASIQDRLSGRRDGNPQQNVLGPTSARLSTPPTTTTPQTTEDGTPAPSNNAPAGTPDLWQLKRRLQRRLVTELSPRGDTTGAQVRRRIEGLFEEMLEEEGVLLSRVERARLFEAITADILAFGPIQPLLHDESVSEIMVNGPYQVYVERKGVLEETDIAFEDDEHVRRIIDRIVAPLGRRCDEASPMVDARLPDGSRVNAIIPPLSVKGPVLTIRKFSREPLTVQDLIGFGSMSSQVADFLSACIRGRASCVISGGTGSGKTTMLNVLSSFIPTNERIITIEDAAELQLSQSHVVTLEKRPANIEGKGEVPIRQLVINALRMRPDRIVVGECRGPEALDMLQAMNTGHDGSLTTIHSNSPRDTLSRIETMVLMAGTELPLRAIREQISSALDLIVHVERVFDGSRKIVKVCEVQGLEGDVIVLQDLFQFQQAGFEGRRVAGRHMSLGIRPKFLGKLEMRNVHVPPNLFMVDTASEGVR